MKARKMVIAAVAVIAEQPLEGYAYLLALLKQERLFRAMHQGMSSVQYTKLHTPTPRGS